MPGLAGPDRATLHYQSRMSLCLTQMRVNKYSEGADLCISGGGGTGNAVTSRERLGSSLIPAEKKWRLGDKNHCLGDGEEKEDGAEESTKGVQRTLFMMILSRMSCKTSATLQLGRVCKPAAVVLQLWEAYRASAMEKESHKDLAKVLCNP